MSKVNVQIEVPENIHGRLLEKKLLEKVAKHALEQAVLELYQESEISTGTGARLLGIPLYDFIQFLGEHNVSIFNYSPEELEEDVKAAEAAVRPEVKEKKEKQ